MSNQESLGKKFPPQQTAQVNQSNKQGNEKGLSTLTLPKEDRPSSDSSEELLKEVKGISNHSTDFFRIPYGPDDCSVSMPRTLLSDLDDLQSVMQIRYSPNEPLLPFSEALLKKVLVTPLQTRERVLQRREAIETVAENVELARAIRAVLTGFKQHTKGGIDALTLFGMKSYGSSSEASFSEKIKRGFRRCAGAKEARENIAKTLEAVANLPSNNSRYLNSLQKEAQALCSSRSFALLREKTYLTPRGVIVKGEKSPSPLRLPWTFGGISKTLVATIGCHAASAGLLTASYAKIMDPLYAFPLGASFGLLGFVSTILDRVVEVGKEQTFKSFANRIVESPTRGVVNLVGELEVLLNLSLFDSGLKSAGWKHAQLAESGEYTFTASGLRHPLHLLWSKEQKEFALPYDLSITPGQPVCVTGPNRGGKSTLGSAVFFSQLFTQLGLRIPCNEATMSVCDTLIYQDAPSVTSRWHGRLERQLKTVKGALQKASPASLVILDEVIGGASSAEENSTIEQDILEAFRKLGGGLIHVTHNHDIVRKLAEEGKVHAVTFAAPEGSESQTYNVQLGVASSSSAQRIVQQVGITPDGLDQLILKRRNE